MDVLHYLKLVLEKLEQVPHQTRQNDYPGDDDPESDCSEDNSKISDNSDNSEFEEVDDFFNEFEESKSPRRKIKTTTAL